MSVEKVYYFSFISMKGGCGSSGHKENHWIALTDKRVLYKTKVSEKKSGVDVFVLKEGILPFDKISFLEVTEGQQSNGCSRSKVFQLRISTSGGTVSIPVPTQEKCYEIRKVFTELGQNG